MKTNKFFYWKKYPNWDLQFKKFPDEGFREIKEYNGLYFISNYGQIVSFYWKNPFVLRYGFNSGFFYITLYLNKEKSRYPVHDLVYTHFVGEIEPGKKVVHRNKVTTDNYYKNLELLPISDYIRPGKEKKLDLSLYREIQSERPDIKVKQTPILQFDIDGKFIKEYPTIKEAAVSCGLTGSNICQITVEPLSAGGYQWRLKNDPLFKNGIINIKPLAPPYRYTRDILQFDLSGNLIKEYPSILEASRAVNGSYSTINHCAMKLLPTTHGFQWRYKDDPDLSGAKPKLEPIYDWIYRPQPILQYTREGKFIKEYGSIADAADECRLYHRNIKNCLEGKNKTAKGYQWRYKKGADIPREIPAIKIRSMGRYFPPRPVLQFSKEGKFIKEYSTAKKAAQQLKISFSEIIRCLVKKTKRKTFQWRYKDNPLFKNGIVDLPPVRSPKIKSGRSILQYDIEGNFKREFNSIHEAARYVGITPNQISTCLDGKLITTGGFIWAAKIPGHEKSVIEKQRQLKPGQLISPQPILQFNLKGKFIAKYPSLIDASRKSGTSMIQIKNCVKGLCAFAKKWQWRKADDPMFINGIVDIEPVHYSRYPRSKPILQFNENGIFLKEYPSINEAARTSGLSYKNLHHCIKENRKTAGGFQWRSKDDPVFDKGIVNIGPVKRATISKAILQFDLKGHYLRAYPSIKKAAHAVGTLDNVICSCARGKVKSAGGFQWRYREDPRFVHGIEDIEAVRWKSREKPVLQFDIKGNYIGQYSSTKEAARQTGAPALSIRVCSQGKSKTAGGFQWRYKNEPLFSRGIINIKPLKETIRYNCRPVLQFDLEGNFIARYSSASKAGRSIGIKGSGISNCARGVIKSAGNYQWHFKDDPILAKGAKNIGPVMNKARKSILQFDLEGNYITRYISAVSAASAVGLNSSTISNCAKKIINSAGGYQWRYRNDPIFANGIVNIGPVKEKKSNSKSVLQFNLQGKFIAQYTTCLEAAREVGIASNYIACAANPNVKTKTAKGYQWRYRDDSIFARGIKDTEPVKMENLAPVLQFDLNGRYITQYVSIKEATDKTGITGDLISAAARGKVKTAKGFQWRYLDDPLFTHGIVNIAPVKRLKSL